MEFKSHQTVSIIDVLFVL